MQSSITAVSQLLNLAPTQLVRQLGTGQSLASVAGAQGVSRQSVIDAVSKAITANAPQGASPLSADLTATISARIADSTGVPGGFSLGNAR